MSRHWKASNKHCFEMFGRAQVVNMTIVMKPLRNSEYPKADDSKKERNSQYCPNFLVSYKKICVDMVHL